jgi:hypothetical protein
MPFGKKIILHVRPGPVPSVDDLVERFVRGGVRFVAVVGRDCARLEDMIDAAVVGDGSDDSRFILTSSHLGETLDEAVEFARCLSGEYAGDVEIVELGWPGRIDDAQSGA